MKYKALFWDFYGTLVHEDDREIAEITQQISACSPAKNPPAEIASSWWSEFRLLFENSCGTSYRTQRELETISIKKTLEYFRCADLGENIDSLLFSHWVRPDIFEDTAGFLAANPLPVCIVSNIDRSDILQAIDFHGMTFQHVVTSEDARSYKPRPEIFRLALKKTGLLPGQVLHIGDSLSSDIDGARNYGIDTFWLNRKKRGVPANCAAKYIGGTLCDVLNILKS